MKKFFRAVVGHPKLVIAVFAILFVVCGISQSAIKVDYDMNDYLPEDSASTVALDVMDEEFGGGVPNARVMIENVTIRFRKEYVKAVLRHDVDFIESISPGRLGQRFSEESSRIVTGLGPDLGTMIRFVTSMITGCIIGFIYVRYYGENSR